MTVGQLIEVLQTLPQDLPVYLRDWAEGCQADISIDDVDVDVDGGVLGLLPRVVDAVNSPPRRRLGGQRWNHPRRVVIG